MIYFEDIYDLSDIIDNMAYEDGCNCHIVAKYETIKDLFNTLISYNGLEVDSAVLLNPEFADYDKEFMLTVYEGGEILDVFPIYDEKNGYAELCNSDDCIMYIENNCNKSLINKYVDSIVFSFGTEEKVEADNNIVVFDDGHYISQTHTDENGNFYSKSFYSDDINLVKSIMESWK